MITAAFLDKPPNPDQGSLREFDHGMLGSLRAASKGAYQAILSPRLARSSQWPTTIPAFSMAEHAADMVRASGARDGSSDVDSIISARRQ